MPTYILCMHRTYIHAHTYVYVSSNENHRKLRGADIYIYIIEKNL